MVVENEITSFLGWLIPTGSNWYEGALFQFLVTGAVFALGALLLGFLVLLVRYGPAKAGDLTYRTFTDGLVDLVRISPRRVGALAWLSIKESWRRQAIIALVIYGVILSFASWFLKTNQDPAKVQVDFVMAWTTFLMLLQGLLLSAFSLPNDFKAKTIYTIVTKPVRACDIVLGRILGFTLLGTVMLAIMGSCSYLYVNRSLSHTHTIDATRVENIVDPQDGVIGRAAETSFNNDHSHPVETDPDGAGEALSSYGHRHLVRAEGDRLVVGDATDFIRARVPKRAANLNFLDRQGVEADRGVSVGSEWDYRSFIAGGTNAAAIWTFDGLSRETLATDGDVNYLPVELIVRVFRTHKGDIEEAIRGSIQLRNPDNREIKSSLVVFPAKDMSVNSFRFTETLFDAADQKPINLIDDLVSEDGRVEVVVQCIDGGQYFGFARADCYVRLPEGNPAWNFVKGHLGIWVQMVIVITIGVLASTFLNGPIAALLTVSFILLGFFRDFFVSVATGTSYGGGPIESFVRLITQMNLTTPFSNETGAPVRIMKTLDDVIEVTMQAVASVLPDFYSLSSATYVAQGYDIPAAVVGRQVCIALAYIVGFTVAGYFLLRTREVAK